MLMTYKQAANYLGFQMSTLYSYVNRGLIPYVITVTGSKRFDKEELDSFLNPQRKCYKPSGVKLFHKTRKGIK